MSMPIRLPLLATGLVVLLAGVFVAGSFVSPAAATHQPADKVAVAGSTLQVSQPGEVVELLRGTIRSSSPTDLVLQLSLECSIVTKVATVGNDESEAFGRVEVWIELDGKPVGVVSGDDGRVVFCDRAHRQTTSLFDDRDATIETYLSTRSAHSFNWITLNVGHGLHTIVAKALLTERTDGSDAFVDAIVGKRTLVVEPTKLANDAVI